MADTAAHWVDNVLPPVPIRQWVLSFPREIRYILMRDSTLLTRAHDLYPPPSFVPAGELLQATW